MQATTTIEKMEDIDTETASETSVEEKAVHGYGEKPEGWVETDNDKPAEEEKKKKKKKSAKKAGVQKSKPGQGRPFAKLAQDVLQSRMDKLKKRIDRSKHIHEKAEKFYAKYVREAECRAKALAEPEKPKDT